MSPFPNLSSTNFPHFISTSSINVLKVKRIPIFIPKLFSANKDKGSLRTSVALLHSSRNHRSSSRTDRQSLCYLPERLNSGDQPPQSIACDRKSANRYHNQFLIKSDTGSYNQSGNSRWAISHNNQFRRWEGDAGDGRETPEVAGDGRRRRLQAMEARYRFGDGGLFEPLRD